MRSPRSRIRTTLALALAILVALALIAGCSDSERVASEPETSPEPLPRGENTGALLSMLDLLNSAKNATYQVAYDFGGDVSAGIQPGTLTITQRPPQLRTDLAGSAGSPGIALIGDDAGTVACQSQQGDEGWQCFQTSAFMRQSPVAVTSDDLIQVADALRSAQGYYSFVEHTEEIAGQEATCVSATATAAMVDDVRERVGDAAEICATSEGVPLVVETRGSARDFSVRARSYTAEVEGSAFQPPAPVQPGTPNFEVPAPPSTVPVGD